jgi:hypothetical protein
MDSDETTDQRQPHKIGENHDVSLDTLEKLGEYIDFVVKNCCLLLVRSSSLVRNYFAR